MLEELLRVMVVAIGAAITIASMMVAGLRLHLLGQCYGAPIPKDAAIIAGAGVGVCAVVLWFT